MEEVLTAADNEAKSGNGVKASRTMRSGGKVYFFDVRESKAGNSYLQIAELSRSQNGQSRRNSIVVFPDHLNEFRQTLNEVAAHLSPAD